MFGDDSEDEDCLVNQEHEMSDLNNDSEKISGDHTDTRKPVALSDYNQSMSEVDCKNMNGGP